MPESAGQVKLSLPREAFTLQVEFDIPKKGVLGVFGPSGCGKTSLLRCIAGLERDAKGSVRVNGDTWQDSARGISVPAHARRVGVVFQDGRLFPHLTAAQNLDYGAARSKGTESISREHVIELLALEPLINKKPDDLSGGEQQRVAIGRAMLRNPKLLLMDEPLANLDAERKQDILPFLDRLHAEISLPMLFVSHSVDEVCRLCDHVILLDQGKATTAAAIDRPHELMEQPALHAFYGTVVNGVVIREEEPGLVVLQTGLGELRVPGKGNINQHIRLRIPAGDVALSRDRPGRSSVLNVLECRITKISQQNSNNRRILMRCAEGELLAQVTEYSFQRLLLAEGQIVFAMIKGLAIRNLQ